MPGVPGAPGGGRLGGWLKGGGAPPAARPPPPGPAPVGGQGGGRLPALPLWCPAGAYLLCRPPTLPLGCFPAPIPPTPFPGGEGGDL